MLTTIISYIIGLLLLLLLGTALYKGIFKKNKINNPYSSEFEDITSGTKPNMDGRNPIQQTKEKVQQEMKEEKTVNAAMMENEEDILKKGKSTTNIAVAPPLDNSSQHMDEVVDDANNSFEKPDLTGDKAIFEHTAEIERDTFDEPVIEAHEEFETSFTEQDNKTADFTTETNTGIITDETVKDEVVDATNANFEFPDSKEEGVFNEQSVEKPDLTGDKAIFEHTAEIERDTFDEQASDSAQYSETEESPNLNNLNEFETPADNVGFTNKVSSASEGTTADFPDAVEPTTLEKSVVEEPIADLDSVDEEVHDEKTSETSPYTGNEEAEEFNAEQYEPDFTGDKEALNSDPEVERASFEEELATEPNEEPYAEQVSDEITTQEVSTDEVEAENQADFEASQDETPVALEPNTTFEQNTFEEPIAAPGNVDEEVHDEKTSETSPYTGNEEAEEFNAEQYEPDFTGDTEALNSDSEVERASFEEELATEPNEEPYAEQVSDEITTQEVSTDEVEAENQADFEASQDETPVALEPNTTFEQNTFEEPIADLDSVDEEVHDEKTSETSPYTGNEEAEEFNTEPSDLDENHLEDEAVIGLSSADSTFAPPKEDFNLDDASTLEEKVDEPIDGNSNVQKLWFEESSSSFEEEGEEHTPLPPTTFDKESTKPPADLHEEEEFEEFPPSNTINIGEQPKESLTEATEEKAARKEFTDIPKLNGHDIPKIHGEDIPKVEGKDVPKVHGYEIPKSHGEDIENLHDSDIPRKNQFNLHNKTIDELEGKSEEEINPEDK